MGNRKSPIKRQNHTHKGGSMKITLTHYKTTHTVETEYDDVSPEEVFDMFIGLLLSLIHI